MVFIVLLLSIMLSVASGIVLVYLLTVEGHLRWRRAKRLLDSGGTFVAPPPPAAHERASAG
jgi:hypothetical protein